MTTTSVLQKKAHPAETRGSPSASRHLVFQHRGHTHPTQENPRSRNTQRPNEDRPSTEFQENIAHKKEKKEKHTEVIISQQQIS